MTSLRPEEESLLPSHEIQPFQETQELSFISLEEEKKNTTLPHLIVVLAAFDSYLYRLQSLQNTEENQTDFNALLVALTVLASLLSVYLLFRKNKESPTDLELSLNIPGLDTLNDRVYKMHRYLQLDLAEQHLSELGEMYQNNPRRPFIIEDLKKDYQTARTVFHQEVGRLNILLDVTQDADSGSYELENALHGVTLRLENLEKAIDTIKARHAETSRKVQEAPKRLIEAKALHQKDMLKFPNSEAENEAEGTSKLLPHILTQLRSLHDRNKTYLQSATQHLKDGNALNCAELVDRYLTQRVEILLLMQRAQDAQKNQDALRPKITALFKDKLHFDSHAQLLNIGNLNLSLVINFLDLSSPTVSYAHVEFDNYDFHMKELEKFIDVLFAILTQRDLLESSAMYQDRDRSHNAVATLHQLSEVLIKDAFGYATMREWNSANVMLKELSVYMQHIENAPKIDAESRFVVSEEIQSLATNLERMWAQTEDLSKKRSDKNDDTEFTRKITTLLEELSGVDSIIVVLQGALDSGEVARYSLQSQLIKAKHELQLLQLRISSLEMEYSQETVAQEQTYVFYGPSKNALEERDATVRSKQSALTLLLTESETIQLSDEIYERVAGFQEKVHSTRVRSIRFLSGYGEATNGELNILLAEYDSLILNEFESIKNQLVIAREAHEKLVKNAQSQYATVINKRNMIEAALHRFSITPTVEEMFRRACELLVRQPELNDTPPEIVASLKNLELVKTLFDTVASLMSTEMQAQDKQIMTHKQEAEAQRAKILKRPDADEKRRMAEALELAKQFRINSVNLYVSE